MRGILNRIRRFTGNCLQTVTLCHLNACDAFHLCCRIPIGVYRFRNEMLNTHTSLAILGCTCMLRITISALSPSRAPSRRLRKPKLRSQICKIKELGLLKIAMNYQVLICTCGARLHYKNTFQRSGHRKDRQLLGLFPNFFIHEQRTLREDQLKKSRFAEKQAPGQAGFPRY